MRLEPLCSIEADYVQAHFPNPYGDQSGPGWGVLEGTVSGQRLSGTLTLSNHPSIRSDGVALPDARGLITTPDGCRVLVALTGRTVFVQRDDTAVGRQLLMALFESADDAYTWLNNEVCIAEGIFDPDHPPSHMDIYLCQHEL